MREECFFHRPPNVVRVSLSKSQAESGQQTFVGCVHLELKRLLNFVDVPVVENTAFLPAWDV